MQASLAHSLESGDDMFASSGVHILVDGQYGSTGKGLFASYLASKFGRSGIITNISSAGPNSGHTFYDPNGNKHVLKQLPTFAVWCKLNGWQVPTIYLCPGAVVNPLILMQEAEKYGVKVLVAETAAQIHPTDIDWELDIYSDIHAVAGTRQGVGSAVAQRVQRNPKAIMRDCKMPLPDNIRIIDPSRFNWRIGISLFEVSQGFSLGLHDKFYPHVTSRECTVAQAMADIRASPFDFGGAFMSIRTFPIRVGNDGGISSGPCYEDQEEIGWTTINQEPELTTVTQRVRRLFTFSRIQYFEALRANSPRYVMVNFMNYLPAHEREPFVKMLDDIAQQAINRKPGLLFGFGPKISDVRTEL